MSGWDTIIVVIKTTKIQNSKRINNKLTQTFLQTLKQNKKKNTCKKMNKNKA